MPFCSYSNDNIESNYIVLDNIFIEQYMPDAPPHYTEVYLYGLALCSHTVNNDIQYMSRALNLSIEDIVTAYTYWEDLGLVNVLNTDTIKVQYLPIKSGDTLLRKIKPSKYNSFSKQIQNIIIGRMISITEYNEYYLFLEQTNFEPEALVEVAKYCVAIKGDDINYKYILQVARNWAQKGIRTLASVKDKIQTQPKYTEDIALLFKAMHISHPIDYNDRELYEKWTLGYGFTLDTLLQVAKTIKKGGMLRMDNLLEQYYKNRLLSIEEITYYIDNKNKLFSIAIEINKAIGVYYQSLDAVVEEYTNPWCNRGYDEQTLITIAKYCFKTNIRTLEGMNSIVEGFYKQGLISQESIHQYIAQVLSNDSRIRQLLNMCGINRNVISSDRTNYKMWMEQWNMTDELLDYVAKLSVGASNPMAYMCKTLSNLKNNNITTVAQAEGTQFAVASKTKSEIHEREYSAEELRALFDNLDDVEI